ncbi:MULTISPECIES: transcriptional regulator [unclassified Zymobacter]|uniref:transcriptional regulator n=1 Tax=unclassified Zymobacter TaxID=3048685 RepID=UPI0039C19684
MTKKRNTQLLNWIKTATDEQVNMAGASRSYLRLIAYGHKHPSASVAAGIERATEGAVTRQQLRPQDWPLIWPELADSPEQIAQAARALATIQAQTEHSPR